MSVEFQERLISYAQRAIEMAPRCTNEESTKLFLILPFIGLLGYDDRNPHEVCPEHAADFSEKYKNRVDFAILQNDQPIIAIECKCNGTPLKDERGQLRSYFNAAPTVKMGLLTDGLIYEFYADSDQPNMMDANPFLAVDLRDVAAGKIEENVVDGLKTLRKGHFDPENIGAEAKRKLVFQSFLQQIADLADQPSEPFTRMLLQQAGISNVRSRALPEFQDLVRSAFRAFVNEKILQRLDLSKEAAGILAVPASDVPPSEQLKAEDKITTTETELEVVAFVRRRLAFLVKEEHLFNEIGKIRFRDYQGKFVVFYDRERRGRLFDFIEGVNRGPKYRFQFSDQDEEISAESLVGAVIDEPLLRVFRLRALGEAVPDVS